jgi:hypothetical protein
VAVMTGPHGLYRLLASKSRSNATTGALRSLAARIRAWVVVYRHGMFARSLQPGPERCVRPHLYDIKAKLSRGKPTLARQSGTVLLHEVNICRLQVKS